MVKSEFQKVEKSLYHIPARNKKTGKTEVNTVLKKDLSFVTHINGLGPQLDKQTKADLDKLLDKNKNEFAEDERQIGTTPLIEMTIDTGDHPPIAKKLYTLALKHYDWVKKEIDKLLEAGVIRECHSNMSAEQLLKHIQIVLTRLQQANLKLKKSKSAFFKRELHYLGHLLTTDGI